jgi:ABC-type polysaccharide/polyol phosphate export permease
VHFGIQLCLLMILCLASGYKPSWAWVWLPIVAAFEILFVCGLALIFSALDVLIRDTRYLVESANVVLFWMVPIFYDFNIIPKQYIEIYRLNPVAAVVMAFRNILLEGKAPADSLMVRLALVSTVFLLLGFWFFGAIKRKFYDYL